MNDRILELAKEAGLSYIPSSNSGPLRVEYLFPELEKFAELIIKECIAVLDDSDGSWYHGEKLNEHFGVEE